jgi:hypothetical protein
LALQKPSIRLRTASTISEGTPFRGLPVSRHGHITNVCEMYFGRFYEFRERLKKHLEAVAAITPDRDFKAGPYIKTFDKMFDQELRARNSVHHHERFEDIAIHRVFLTDVISINQTEDRGWKGEHLAAYRRLANEWARRVRRRSQSMEEFLEAVAVATLSNCKFLSELLATSPSTFPSDTSEPIGTALDTDVIGHSEGRGP